MSVMTPVAFGLGSNLGDREASIRLAAGLLATDALVDAGVVVSTVIETAPVDCAPGAPPYLNAALCGHTRLPPHALLDCCLKIEAGTGRDRCAAAFHADRVLDIDILLYGDLVINDDRLRLPHPELHRRAFVLEPLAEIAPNWVVPPGTLTVADLYTALRRAINYRGRGCQSPLPAP